MSTAVEKKRTSSSGIRTVRLVSESFSGRPKFCSSNAFRNSGPLGSEFRKAFDEQNFGLPLKDSLTNLTVRIPLLDVRFFSTAVLIQRETGGNLAEILENLGHVVRE